MIWRDVVVLTNAEKQKRWRDKRNALAKQAERATKQATSINGLITALVRAVKGKTAPEIVEIGLEVQNRLADSMRLNGTGEAHRRALRQRAKQTALTKIRRSRKA